MAATAWDLRLRYGFMQKQKVECICARVSPCGREVTGAETLGGSGVADGAPAAVMSGNPSR